uniref:Uncharacterized protein n=1 Tax=Curvibacter symbiont subsp. Hydra magnipapillata TaxID=667019 RepID=C9Y6P2_CURXX|nr:hypothetical protein Csp_E36190 [Curvibacter putative symbiont of Hydra magnipapillata]
MLFLARLTVPMVFIVRLTLFYPNLFIFYVTRTFHFCGVAKYFDFIKLSGIRKIRYIFWRYIKKLMILVGQGMVHLLVLVYL